VVDKKKIDIEKHDPKMRAGESAEGQMQWHSPADAPFRLAGFAWFDEERLYRRLPSKPEHPLPQAVDSLANCTAGGQIHFQTDSPRLSVRVTLRGPHGMNHMPATGQCGFDCYMGPPGELRYCSTTKYNRAETSYEVKLFDLPTGQPRNVCLNFPLYQGVEEVLVGLDPKAEVSAPPAYAREGCVVVYGTSITQGGCASRPGMAYGNILSRRLNVEFINLGFSGSGRGEPEVAHVMAGIDSPIAFILDYEANCVDTERLKATFPEFVRILRERHPNTPILAVSRIRSAGETFNPEVGRTRLERRDFQRQTVEALRRQGDSRIVFKDGTDLLGDDFDECTVDGSHPTDLGFLRMADGLTPVVRELLDMG